MKAEWETETETERQGQRQRNRDRVRVREREAICSNTVQQKKIFEKVKDKSFPCVCGERRVEDMGSMERKEGETMLILQEVCLKLKVTLTKGEYD